MQDEAFLAIKLLHEEDQVVVSWAAMMVSAAACADVKKLAGVTYKRVLNVFLT